MTGINAYIAIFIIKTIGGGLANYRLILMKEGNKFGTALVTMFSSLTWILSMGLVVGNVSEDMFIIIPFVVAVVLGNYIGIFIDNKIKTGNVLTTIITSDENKEIIEIMKKNGFEVHSFKAEGMDENKKLIMITTQRKQQQNLMNKMKESRYSNFIISEKIEEEF